MNVTNDVEILMFKVNLSVVWTPVSEKLARSLGSLIDTKMFRPTEQTGSLWPKLPSKGACNS